MAGRPRKVVDEPSIHKVEEFNGEVAPEISEDKEGSIGWRMTYEEKLQSILNSVKVLPPNMIRDGRHLIENIQALNCFKVSQEMVDKVYATFEHEV